MVVAALIPFLLAWLGLAHADEDGVAIQAELDRVRAEIAGEVHLAAYDLVDEMAYGWINDPVFAKPTPVVLAEVTVPVGLGTGMAALIENHIGTVLTQNPRTNMQLVHCPSCTAVVVHSGPEGTVVTRGYDNPRVLEEMGDNTGKHALFVDFEAEGSWLVMRARLTKLTPDLPIVWSHTLASSASTPSLLREASDLKSAAEARAEYLDTLQSRGPVTIPLRFAVRTYAQPWTDQGTPPPPFLWLQTGAEIATTDSRAWFSSLVLGYSFIPQAYQGIMGQARIYRLLGGPSRSLTRPNPYAYVGVAAISVWGPATAAFREETLTADELLTDSELAAPRNTFGALQGGFDVRIGNRVGLGMFLESLPVLRNSNNIGQYAAIGTLRFQTFGTEVTFCF